MPWMETRVTEQRTKFVAEYELGLASMAELCRKYGISRKTGYKWLARWRAEGTRGPSDRSRAPGRHPNRVAPERVAAILDARDRFGWGPKKLRVLLAREQPEVRWPALSTMQQILKDHARIVPRKKRRRIPVQSQPLSHCDGPNTVWCCDFKGHFLTGEGRRCYPLTITDGFSRYLLRCQGLARSDHASSWPIFECAFREYGLPRAIRSDNGVPFASRAVAGLSRLSVWWLKLGIVPERIEPGKPQQNGRHERMHLTLKQATANPPAGSSRRQQLRFDAFRHEYNTIRPHESLDMRTPASVYEPSPRPYPEDVPGFDYPNNWLVRKIQKRGEFYWKHQPIFLSEVLCRERIGLEPVQDQYWRAHFGPVYLGVFDSHRRRMLTAAEARRRPHLLPSDSNARPSATLQDEHSQE